MVNHYSPLPGWVDILCMWW